MKEQIINFIKEHRGGLAYLAIACATSFIFALISYICGGNDATVIASSAVGGTLAVLTIGTLYNIVNISAPMDERWGISGIVLGVVITMIIL